MIVRINGEVLNGIGMSKIDVNELETIVKKSYKKKDIKKLQKLSVWLWSVSGIMLSQTKALAATSGTQSLWTEMGPIFHLFQEIGMVIGAFAIIGGLLVMIFKKRTATKIISTAAIAVAGVFLVPSAIMLIAIIGSMMNDALTGVFSQLNIGGSVKVK